MKLEFVGVGPMMMTAELDTSDSWVLTVDGWQHASRC